MSSVVILLVFLLKVSSGARILGVVPTPSYSHQVVFQPLWTELLARGHHLTVLTTDPIKDPLLTNLTEIDLSFSYKILQEGLLELIDDSQSNFVRYVLNHIKLLDKICDQQLSHPEVQQLIQGKEEHFDLLLVELMNPTMFAFSQRFNCPYIAMSTVEPSGVNWFLGNPDHLLLYPGFLSTGISRETIWERTKIVLGNLVFRLVMVYAKNLPNEQMKKHFGKEYAKLFEEMSLMFVNSNPIFDQVKPLVPAIIRIGGAIQIRKAKPLSKDLNDVLNNSTQGFVYFSLGSNVKSKDLSENTVKVILETFSELPYTFLWKFENEDLSPRPNNVVVSKWFSQQDILRHPNIRLFITQGGKQSLDETIYFKVPIIGMPFFADQPLNVKTMVSKGVGLEIDYKILEKDIFKRTILEVIENPRYRNRMVELSNLVLDEPMSGLEKAVWWSEYVIRHKGARHLRSPAIDMPFYQYYLLDVVAVCVLTLSVLLYLVVFVTTKLWKLMWKTKHKIE